MEQIDWIEEQQKKIKEEKRKFDEQPWWKKREASRKLQIFDFKCDHCMRTIIVQFRHKPGHKEKLVCLCGRDYIINAEVVEKWIKEKPYIGF